MTAKISQAKDCGYRMKIAAVVAILLPILISLVLPYVLFNRTFFDIIPTWNDEVVYWHEILTFSQVGFKGGYYTVEELPALASFTHFYVQGPVFPIFFSIIGLVFGWYAWSGAFFNIILFTITLVVFVFFIKPDFKQSFALGLFLLTFWPILFYLPSIMQQVLHQASAVLLAVLFWNMIDKGVDTPFAIKITLVLFILFISFFRPTWALLLFPFILFLSSPFSKLRLALTLLGAFVTNFIMMFLWKYLGSRYPSHWLDFLHVNVNSSLYDWINQFFLHMWNNIQSSIDAFFSRTGHLMEVLLRLNLMVIIAAFAIAWIGVFFFKRKEKTEGRYFIIQRRETLFHLLNLGLPLVFNILFYDIRFWRGYRLFAPHLLLSMLVLIASRKKLWIAGLVIGINLFGVTSFVPLYKLYHTKRFIHRKQRNISFIQSIQGVLEYEKGKSPWCNTLLSTAIAPPPFRNIPAGIGISFIIRPERLQLPLKSKYLLVDESENYYKEWTKKQNLKLLANTIYGNLYLNKDSECY